MKAFIDYFWYQEGYVYDPLEGQTFSIYHIIMLLLCILVFIALWKIGAAIKNKNRLLIIIAVVLFVFEVLRIINIKFVYGTTWIGAFSFHLCAMGTYLMIIAGLFRKKWMFEFVSLHCFIGAPLAIIIPLGILPWYNPYSFLPLQSYLTHLILFFAIIYAWRYKFFNIPVKRYYIPVISILFSSVVAYFMSIYNLKHKTGGSTNFFWTRVRDPLFDSFLPLPHPYYFLVLLAALFTAGLILFSILKSLEQKKHVNKK